MFGIFDDSSLPFSLLKFTIRSPFEAFECFELDLWDAARIRPVQRDFPFDDILNRLRIIETSAMQREDPFRIACIL